MHAFLTWVVRLSFHSQAFSQYHTPTLARRRLLFNEINSLPTCLEVVTGSAAPGSTTQAAAHISKRPAGVPQADPAPDTKRPAFHPAVSLALVLGQTVCGAACVLHSLLRSVARAPTLYPRLLRECLRPSSPGQPGAAATRASPLIGRRGVLGVGGCRGSGVRALPQLRPRVQVGAGGVGAQGCGMAGVLLPRPPVLQWHGPVALHDMAAT